MFELLGSETEYEAATKRVMNLQMQIIKNYDQICQCYTEITSLQEENEMLDNALKYWKEEIEKYNNAMAHPANIETDLTGATLATKQEIKKKKKPTTK